MVIPLGGGGGPGGAGGGGPPGSQTAPDHVKDSKCYAYMWQTMGWACAICGVCQWIALDIFGGLNSVLMAYITYTMRKRNFQEMTQCCLLVFMVLCFTNFLFSLPILITNFSGGRQETTVTTDPEMHSKTYTIEKHPLFDSEGTDYYNFQSLMMVVYPVTQLFAFLLAYVTYDHYPTGIFEEDAESQPVGRYGGGSNGGGNYGGGGGGYGSGRNQSGGGGGFSGGGRPASSVRLFEGQGQTLGAG